MVTWSGWRGVGNGDLEWLERCGQWGGTWSGWRGVGNGDLEWAPTPKNIAT